MKKAVILFVFILGSLSLAAQTQKENIFFRVKIDTLRTMKRLTACGITYPESDTTAGFVMSTNGAGVVSLVNSASIIDTVGIFATKSNLDSLPITNISYLQDTISRHTDTLQAHNTRIKKYIQDSAYIAYTIQQNTFTQPQLIDSTQTAVITPGYMLDVNGKGYFREALKTATALQVGILNNIAIDTASSLRMSGTSTVWNDLVFPFTTGSTGGLSYPAFVADSNYFVFTPDTTGPAKCIIYKIIQMPHYWKEGSSVYPHVHYKHETAVGTPTFIVKYKWFNIGERTTPNWSWRRLELTTGTTDLTHQQAYSATPISGVGKTISSILLVQVYLRDAPTNVNAYQFDIHVEQAQLGSNTETSLN